MAFIPTLRLVIVTLPAGYPLGALRRKKTVLQMLRRVHHFEEARQERDLQKPMHLSLHLFLKEGSDHVGVISARWLPERQAYYAGYSIEAAYWNQGYATEAFRAVCVWLMKLPGVDAVIAESDRKNEASIRVMEKVGMTRIDLRQGTLVRYALTRPGANANVGEDEVLTLAPFAYSEKRHLNYFLRWQMRQFKDLAMLATFVAIIAVLRDPIVVFPVAIGLCWLVFDMARRFSRWKRQPAVDMFIELRSSTLLYVYNDRYGDATPWSEFPAGRLSARGGLELWNTSNWFWIPPEAFMDVSVERAKKFIEAQGVKFE